MRQNDSPAGLPTLGVLGGMGPAATADFLYKLAMVTPAQSDQEHFPLIVYSDPTTPDRSDALLKGGPDPVPAFVRGIKFLVDSHVEGIAIPCNTAHYWLDEMREASSVPIIDIVEAVAVRIRKERPTLRSVGLLSTDGTALSGVYKWLEKDNLRVLDLTDLGRRNPVMLGIRAVKAGDMQEARTLLNEASSILVSRGAEGLIYGCTDVSAALGVPTPGVEVPAWDSSESLALATVNFMSQFVSQD